MLSLIVTCNKFSLKKWPWKIQHSKLRCNSQNYFSNHVQLLTYFVFEMKMICISTYYRSSVGGSQREGQLWRGGTCLPRTTREDMNVTQAPNKWSECDSWEQGEDVTSYRADWKVNSQETSPSQTTYAIVGTNGSAGPMGSPVCETSSHCSDKSLRFVDTHSTFTVGWRGDLGISKCRVTVLRLS